MTKSIATASVTREAANALIDAALEAACLASFAASVAVVDAAGKLRAFQRADEATFFTVDVAVGKAWTAAASGFPTHAWNDLVADPQIAPLGHLPGMVAVSGGYPLRDNGRLIGGIGVSGGTCQQDNDAAARALIEVGFPLP